MSFFSDERMGELRELFFESAQELLQTLNEEGLQLEKTSDDAATVRGVRRTVHTLKGDSAAVGYRELSELAHHLEDVLTPEIAASSGPLIAEVVLSAADVFEAMLAAYRGNLQPPSGEPLEEMIARLAQRAGRDTPPQVFHPTFNWTKYERLILAGALDQGRSVYNVAVQIHPACAMKGAALQLLRNVLQECGSILAIRPEEGTKLEGDVVEAVLSSDEPRDVLARHFRIPAVTARIVVEPLAAGSQASPAAPEPSTDLLGIMDCAPATAGTPQPKHGVAARATDEPGSEPAVPVLEAPKSEVPRAATPASTENVLRVEAERVDSVLNLMGELVIAKSMLQQVFSDFSKRFAKDPICGPFADALAFQARVLNDLQRSVMKIRMVPVEQLFRRFPRLVRDVCRQSGKDAALIISGQDTDLDKSILDVLAEPLAHLLRNAVDHGLESPEERVAAGKPAQGTVRLNAYHHGNQVVIEIEDDGRGIDRKKLTQRAVTAGIIGAEEAARLTDQDAYKLMFESGVSTAEQVTPLSGRGVGMDVVRSVLERLKGTVNIETTSGAGTKFLLKVPLTLAIIKALLFRVNEHLYAIPLNSVLEITRAAESEIHRVDNHDVLRLRDEVLTLARLGQLVNGGAARQSDKMFVIVIGMADRKFGLIVDRLIGEEELVIKALDDRLVATDLISGGSILGDGTVVLILNIQAVVERLGRIRPPAGVPAVMGEVSA